MAEKRSIDGAGWMMELCVKGAVDEAVVAMAGMEKRAGGEVLCGVAKGCMGNKEMVGVVGRNVHAVIVKSGYEENCYVGRQLIRMYGSVGMLAEAKGVFAKVRAPNAYVWAAIISAHAELGRGEEGIELYKEIKGDEEKVHEFVYVSVLQACSRAGDVNAGQLIHRAVMEAGLEGNAYVGNALLDMYMKCGRLEDAVLLFHTLPSRDVVSWSGMISGYVVHGFPQHALQLYTAMQGSGIQPDKFTFASILKACSSVGALQQGKQLHAHICESGLESDVFIGNILVDMYVKCGGLDDARAVFDRMLQKDVVTWTAMIGGYARLGLGAEALHLFASMQCHGITPDKVTLVTVLKVCASLGALQEGKRIHAYLVASGLEVEAHLTLANTLLHMYARCGCLHQARKLFDSLPRRDGVTLSVMIGGYVEQGLGEEALELYHRHRCGTPPNSSTFATILKACGSLGAIQQGRSIHAHILQRPLILSQDVCVGNSLVDMYVKCGSLDEAFKLFQSLPLKDVVTWNSLINGFAHHNQCGMAIQTFHHMLQHGCKPDAATFTTLFLACTHVGMVKEGEHYFLMMLDLGIPPTMQHYTCFLDLLARSGHLHRAVNLLLSLSMPFPSLAVAWRSLLSACKTYGDVELGALCFHQLQRLDSHHAAAYVLMSNIYANAGRWEEVAYVNNLRRRAGILHDSN